MYYPDSYYQRPHPIVWRAILGIASAYFLFILFIASLSLEKARNILTIFDDNLGKEIVLKPYAADCRIYTP